MKLAFGGSIFWNQRTDSSFFPGTALTGMMAPSSAATTPEA